MRWKTGRRSSHIEDRRGTRAGGRLAKGGIGTVVIAMGLAYFLGVDPRVVFQLQESLAPTTTETDYQPTAKGQEQAEFVSVVLADTEDTWSAIFRQSGYNYEKPNLVLFTGRVNSACGMASAAMGPFYCPADKKVYIDLAFFDDLKSRHGASGDFAQAYVIAHEIGHHVQNLLGTSSQVNKAQRGLGKSGANALSVKLELQADCFAGLWGNHADRSRQILERGDIEEALNAASAIGDDRLQKEGKGYVVPESFTHGTSKQRVHWFKQGITTGDVGDCDTFGAE
ncbi:MAG TPA: flagellar biosynthesis protein FlgM [Gammaproteobacteria bacterium]|nr:flagellar biosynthesis protein FlgM [Gammaproteobacteria bacterium]